MLPTLEELNASLNPMSLIYAYHHSSLIVHSIIVTADLDLGLKVACLTLIIEMSIIHNNTTVGNSPEISFWSRLYLHCIVMYCPLWGFVVPLHSSTPYLQFLMFALLSYFYSQATHITIHM